MKNVYLGLLLLISVSCRSQTDTAFKINADEFEKGINNHNNQVLDVRTTGEYTSGHIKNAMLSDWTDKDQFNERIQYVDKDRPVYIYCLVGGRSSAAADWMRKNGFKSVIELKGGINAWKAANKPLEGTSTEKQMTIEEYWNRIPKNKITLVDFGAKWCPPCVKMEPVISDLQKTKGLEFLILKIDAGVHTGVMKALNISPIPVFIIYKNGKEVWRKEGIVTKAELLAQLK